MRKPWHTLLIVKLLGKVLGFKALSIKVQQLWHFKGNYNIIYLGNGYFLLKFQKKAYYNHVLEGGPQIIVGHYLTVRQWFPNFQPSCDKIESLVAWVCFPKLPMEYYTVMAIWRIASCLGWVIRIDRNTKDVQRGRFASVCIDLDLTKPLCSSISLGNVCQFVEDERLQLICFQCGKLGYRKDSCPMSTAVAFDTNKVTSSLTHVTLDMPLETPLQPTEESFGPWMLVQHKMHKLVRG